MESSGSHDSKNQNQSSWQNDKTLDPDGSEFYMDSFEFQSPKEESEYDLLHDTSPANPTSSTSSNNQKKQSLNKKSPIVLGLNKSNKQNTTDKNNATDQQTSAVDTSWTKVIEICVKCGKPGHNRNECKDLVLKEKDDANTKLVFQKGVTPATTSTMPASGAKINLGGKPIQSRITRVATALEPKAANTPQQYLFPVSITQPELPRPAHFHELPGPGGLLYAYPKGIPKSFLRAPTPLVVYASNIQQLQAANMPGASQPNPGWAPNVPQASPAWQDAALLADPSSADQPPDVGDSGDARAYSPSDLYMENTVNEEFIEDEDLDFLDKQAGQKRLSAFERLGPLTQPKKPKLTINLQWNKEESVREVVDGSKEEDEKKYTPVHLRKDVLESTDEMVMKFVNFWPWKKPVKALKTVTSRTSRSVMILEKEQMEEIYVKDGTWIQITATGYPSSWSKEMVLDTILEAVKGKSFIPCFVMFTAKECKFLVIRSRLALMTLHKIGFFVRKEDVDISITISQTNLMMNQLDFIPKLMLRKRLALVYDGETTLDLSNFTTDEVVSHFIYFPLNNITNQTDLTTLHSTVAWGNLTVLNLSRNRISSLSGFEFTTQMPKLRHLDLSHNFLEKVTLLLRFRNMDLHSIKLEGNPLCLDYIDAQHYVNVLRILFPLLQEIDGEPIQRKGELPKIRRNYCMGEASDVIGKFLDVYFPLIDSEDENRKSLVDLYHMKASMTITYRYKMRQGPIYKLCRSLFYGSRVIEEGDLDSVDGAVNISKVINKWPHMKHDPLTFTVDLMHHDSSVTVFKVCGVLKLTADILAEDERLVAFGRTFALHTYDGREYRVANDMVYWDAPGSKLAGTAFREAAVPNNEEWNEVESGFRTRWNFPGCHGAIDGKHITIEAPPNCGSEYFNYKGCNSVVLMAVVDHDYCFRYVNIGANGRNSDAGIFKNSKLRNNLESNLLPKGGFFVGDDAFPLKTYLLKPYSGSNLTEKQKIFNYRLSRARRIVENAFGILASRFRIFHKPIPTDVSTTEKIIRASCALHNWLRLSSPGHYFPRGCVDDEDIDLGTITEGTWRRELIAGLTSITDHNSNYASRAARQLRDNYADFFSGAGAVSWQNRMIS